MEKIGRILLVGVVAGLVLSILGTVSLGTVSRLALTPLAVDIEIFLKEQGFQLVLIGFFFDLAIGFLYVLAFALFKRACPANFVSRFLLFWLMLVLLGVVPKVADVYRFFKAPDFLVLAWLVSWAFQALVVAVVIALLYPKDKKKTEAA
jgi:hypothetical protein